MDIIYDLLALAHQYERELPAASAPAQLPSGAEIAAWIDLALLKPDTTPAHVQTLCQEARQYQVASVCVNPAYVLLARTLLAGSEVRVGTVIGFPLGSSLPTYKMLEALYCLHAGAMELDMVISIGALKGEAYGQVLNEIQGVVQVAHNQRAIVKVTIETALLTKREKIIACLISKAAGADFIKTSTGFGPGGATAYDVDLIHRVAGPEVQVEASGGIRSLTDALAMIQSGASRLGTSSGVQLIKDSIT